MNGARVIGRRSWVLLAAASLLATAACGSTVQTTDRSALDGGAGVFEDGASSVDGLGADGLGGDGLAAPDGVTGADVAGAGDSSAPGSAFGGGPAGGAASDSGGTALGGASGAAPGGAGAAPAAVHGPGVTAKEIFVGITYTENADAANAALGASEITRGDEQANARAVIDDINERGGVAGRKLVPVFHAYDAQSSETRASQDQAACATFTEDNKVVAVMAGGLTDTFSACMTKAGVLQINAAVIIDADRKFFQDFPGFFDVGTMTQDRMMAQMVTSLVRQDYFSGWDFNLGAPGTAKPKLGILSLDTGSWNRPLDRIMLPALAKAGHPVDDSLVYRVHNPASSSEVGQTVADVQSATLRFREAGVTHLVMLDATGSLTLLFAGNSRNQRYFPRLGANTATAMQALYDAGVLDPQQLAGAVGLGWVPTIDLPAGKSDAYLGPATNRCMDMIKKRTGQTFTSTNAASIALSTCDQIYLLGAALNRAGSVVNYSTVRGALEALGGRFAPAAIPSVFFSASRHDGLDRGFDMYWDGACACAKYRGSGYRIPS